MEMSPGVLLHFTNLKGEKYIILACYVGKLLHNLQIFINIINVFHVAGMWLTFWDNP